MIPAGEDTAARTRKAVLLRSHQYETVSRSLPRNGERAGYVERLLESTGATEVMDVEEVVAARPEELQTFHSRSFVTALRNAPKLKEEERLRFGLSDDCSVCESLLEIVLLETGGSIQAANLLAQGEYQVAIWWGGGRHHAKGSVASGYCYVSCMLIAHEQADVFAQANDAVIAIFQLLETFERVMYIDIDVHHGDGVEEAFANSDKVLTVSFHHFAPLFFPGSGSMMEQSGHEGKRCVVNVPLKEGCDDETFLHMFEFVIGRASTRFRPSMVVLQCGADSLHGDPLGEFNLSSSGYVRCLQVVQQLGVRHRLTASFLP
eukprot:767773-Hanusia_phi.AAC.9